MRKKYNTSLHTIRGGLYFKESAKFTSSRYTINYKHFGTLVYKLAHWYISTTSKITVLFEFNKLQVTLQYIKVVLKK